MTKIDIFSGFLGAGKTTLIKKLIAEAYSGEKLVLIENEFGDIGIDGGFLKDSGVNITEMNSGCICCSLVGDFGKALKQVITDYAPDRILIEPSGVGKLSDVIRAVENIDSHDIILNSFTTVVDANKCKMYMKNFGEFFNNQIECAGTIILSHTSGISDVKLKSCLELLREHNTDADILTTPWEQLGGVQILEVIEKKNTLEDELKKLTEEAHCHHDHEHGEECHCHHDHEHDEECHCHHDHEHDEECHCHHDHEHDEECHCHHDHEHEEECHCHHNHEHHHADEVFTSFGAETARHYTTEELLSALSALENEEKYGIILRAKGIVNGTDGFIHFDYVPGEPDVRTGCAAPTGRLCVIGSNLHEDALKELFLL